MSFRKAAAVMAALSSLVLFTAPDEGVASTGHWDGDVTITDTQQANTTMSILQLAIAEYQQPTQVYPNAANAREFMLRGSELI